MPGSLYAPHTATTLRLRSSFPASAIVSTRHRRAGASLLPAVAALNLFQLIIIPYRVWYYCSAAMSHTIKEKQDLLLRAKRIQGQVDALVRALSEERDCSEVLHIMSAVRGAMNSLMSELLEGHIRDHVLNGKQKPSSKQVQAADEVIEMVKSYLK